jgi:hypothetical protein
MLNRLLLISCLSLLVTSIHAQEDSVSVEDMFIEKEFVIILSSTDYKAALRTAKDAATRLQYKLDLRELQMNKESGLTFDKNICEGDGEEYPCYLARGRYDDGSYVSIEYSDAYNSFTKGYYIVIIAGGEKGSSEVRSALAKAKSVYKNAYAKTTKVYMGCMH